MWLRAFFIFMLAVLTIPATRVAAVTVVMAHGDAPRAGQWETLDVGVEIAGGGKVSVQDVRGGLTVDRMVQGAAGEQQVWMPLPFLAAGDLAKDEWPVEVAVTPAEGGTRMQRVVVRRPGGMAGGTFRVAVVEGAGGALEQRVPWGDVTPRPVVFARVKGDVVLTAPPLVFAGFDALLLSRDLREKLKESRALDLLSVGVRLVVVRDGPSPGLSRLPWSEVKGSPAWIVPREPLRRPAVVEAQIGGPSLQVAAAPTGIFRWVVAMVAPLGVVVVLMARGLFRQRTWVFAGSALGLLAVTGVAVWLCEQTDAPAIRRLEWTEVAVGRAAANAPLLALTETVKRATPILSQRVKMDVTDRAVLWPVATSEGEYFAWRDARLSLDRDGGGDEAGSSFSISVRARATVTVLARSAALTHAGTGERWLVEDGYVTHVPAAPEGTQERRLFTEWVASHPSIREALLAWYSLRYEGHHSYVLHGSATAVAEVILDDEGLPLDYRNTP